MMATLNNLQIQCGAIDKPVEERQSQEQVINAACKTIDMVSNRLESSADTMKGLLHEVAEIMTKDILVWGEEHAKNSKIIEAQTKQIAIQTQLIANQTEKLHINKFIIDGTLPIYRRFFVSAEKGMPGFIMMMGSHRCMQHRLIVNKGNDAAHRANFLAHYCLWKEKYLNEDETLIFEKMLRFPPK